MLRSPFRKQTCRDPARGPGSVLALPSRCTVEAQSGPQQPGLRGGQGPVPGCPGLSSKHLFKCLGPAGGPLGLLLCQGGRSISHSSLRLRLLALAPSPPLTPLHPSFRMGCPHSASAMCTHTPPGQPGPPPPLQDGYVCWSQVWPCPTVPRLGTPLGPLLTASQVAKTFWSFGTVFRSRLLRGAFAPSSAGLAHLLCHELLLPSHPD